MDFSYSLKNLGPLPTTDVPESKFTHSTKKQPDRTRLNAIVGITKPRLFVPPKHINYTAFSKAIFHPDHSAAIKKKTPLIRVNAGTTTLGFVFKGGVVLTVDSRATQGPYISSGTVKKVIPVSKYILGTMAGGAADCAFWQRRLGMETRLFQLEHGKRVTVAAASKMFSNTMYRYKGYGLSVGTMISGFDERGPQLYYVDNDAVRIKANKFSVGSGATFAMGILDNGYKWDMTDEEACELGRKSIAHATHRDAYSGGFVNCFLIKKTGWTQVSHEDTNELLWNKYIGKNIRATSKLE